jgi:hypothetical protein
MSENNSTVNINGTNYVFLVPTVSVGMHTTTQTDKKVIN